MTSIRKRQEFSPAPASFAQQRLWFLELLNPKTATYNVPWAFRLRGEVSAAALERALQTVVDRHESLRTRFESRGRAALQVIDREREIRLQVRDFVEPAGAAREQAAAAAVDAMAREPFDLGGAEMLRAALFRLGERESIFLTVTHHIVTDGWSLGLMFQELSEAYAAEVEGRRSALAELPIQYADYAVWQRQMAGEPRMLRQLEQWRERLEGAPAFVELPCDRPRREQASFCGDEALRAIGVERSAAVRELAKRQRVTPFVPLVSAFACAIERWSGASEFCIGTPMANRPRVETEALIGFFVNTALLRYSAAAAPTLGELITVMRRTALDALGRQETPFEQVIQQMRPARQVNVAPYCQMAFALQNATNGDLRLPGVECETLTVHTGTSKFDLTLSLEPAEPEMQVRLEYSSELFDRGTAEKVLDEYCAALDEMSADLSGTVSRGAGAGDSRPAVDPWNREGGPYPREASLGSLFAAQARQRPDAVALAFGDREMSYGELERESRRVARALREAGVSAGDPVAISLPGSAEFVIAALGVIQAGGVYVPLDPTYPEARLELMLRDSQARVMITAAVAPAIGGSSGVLTLPIDAVLAGQLDDAGEGALVDGSSAAYMMYTSGSTGEPKGIVVPHRAVTRLVVGTDYVSLGPGERVAQVSNTSFDASTFEIWGALLNGGTLVGIGREEALDPRGFGAALRQARITTMFVTTALFNVMARNDAGAFATLKTLLFGGEAVDPRAVRAVLEGGAPERLLHVYGPTENTTFSTWHRVEKVSEDAETVAIGLPVGHSSAYVLDADMRPAAAGEPGEIYVGGEGLAIGYWNRPELTAERFVEVQVDSRESLRLYRTGDLGRRRRDGVIEFVARLDDQVKIRGFRIEPGEIEAEIRKHAAVEDCAVVACPEAGGRLRLAAFATARSDGGLAAAELREFLSGRLPEHMVPAQIALIAALPLNANGKVDRPALVEAARSSGQGEGTAAPAQAVAARALEFDDVERAIASIWARHLGRPPVDRGDDFFDCGGHSLAAAEFLSDLEQRLSVSLSLMEFLVTPTLGALADRVRAGVAPTNGSSLQTIQGRGAGHPLISINAVPMMRPLAERMAPEHSFRTVPLIGGEHLTTPFSLEKVAAEIVRIIRRDQPYGPYFLFGWCFDGIVAYEVAQQLLSSGEQVGLLATLDTVVPPLAFRDDLTNGPTPWFAGLYLDRMWKAVSGSPMTRSSKQMQLGIALWETHYRFNARFRVAPRGWLHTAKRVVAYAARQYRPQPITAPMVVIRASGAEFRRGGLMPNDWLRLAEGPHWLDQVPGNHQTAFDPPHVDTLAALLKQRMKEGLAAVNASPSASFARLAP